ncbi:MAG: PKD domain-containing protein [Planctomycetota bacterium]
MNAECDLCHSKGDNKNPYLGISSGVRNVVAGWGCVGCHGRAEDAGHDTGSVANSPGWGAGLRQHHTRNGVSHCTSCHDDAVVGTFILAEESVYPLYYGLTAASLADDPSNPTATWQINENWTVGDFEGLNNDGDMFYDTLDTANDNLYPVADPGGPYSAGKGVDISFDGSGSSDPDGTIVSYDWDFGDGSTATGVSPTYAYNPAENYKRYTVRLTVTDDGGATDMATTTATIGSSSGYVPQTIGMLDVAPGVLVEGDCRLCHSGVPARHHSLYGLERGGAVPPYTDPGGATTWTCVNCHSETFTVERDCLVCHTTASAHHSTSTALSGDCVSCHGDVVDNMNDGHYIPSYTPSMVTPLPGISGDSVAPVVGECDFCHDADGGGILANQDLHHSTGLDTGNCLWCHDSDPATPDNDPLEIRICEGCHGPDSLHNVQADSPNANNIGTLVVGGEDVGGEDSGYGHVGIDVYVDSDCWGCHGWPLALKESAAAPGSGPIIPTVHTSDRAVVTAGTDTVVILSGSAFTNIAAGSLFESDVMLTAADGSPVILSADLIDESSLAVTIPGDTVAGNYRLHAVKSDVASNPVVISVVPEVRIIEATAPKDESVVEIRGSGFGGYAEGSGTVVAGTVNPGNSTTVEAAIQAWSDTMILAVFDSDPPKEVTVNSVFGSATARVSKADKEKGPQE